MNLSFSVLVLATVMFVTNANAALAPNYQRANEMTAVIEAVAEQVPSHPITKIIYQSNDRYQVIAGPCSIRATIVTTKTKPMMVGTRQFKVKLSAPRCNK